MIKMIINNIYIYIYIYIYIIKFPLSKIYENSKFIKYIYILRLIVTNSDRKRNSMHTHTHTHT